jgi:demethylmenaquinone methyltransferase/2-methoxy-6-polyprenyl-1,4-benzoquinol methylase
MSNEPLPPHPRIANHYRTTGEKRAFLRNIFDETAGDYDRLERVLALGSGPWHRREALRRAGLRSGMQVLDVASGTGLVAREAISIVGSTGRVVGVDPSIGMLRQAKSLDGLSAVLGVGEALPFADSSFDFLSMGYALRHVDDMAPAFAEFHRVLKPGGRASILEITRPAGRLGRAALRAYMGLLSGIVRITRPGASRTSELWAYYWQTIDRCAPPGRVMEALREAGFEEVSRRVELGVFSEYTMRRP